MINYIVSFDDLNDSLGEYFNDCHIDFSNFIEENAHLIIAYEKIPTSKIYISYINKTIQKYKPKPFIFIAYSHGNAHQFGCNGMPYISTLNSSYFKNCLFYSTACLTGRELGSDLIKNGCKAFVGYKNSSYAFLNDKYRRISINCDNYAIKLFLLKQDVTIGEAVDSMKRYITQQIDILDQNADNPLYMARLTANREALICIGEKSLKKEDVFS